MVDALHHVINHGQTAREMYRVLKPGGRIVIEEPDIRSFYVKLIAVAEKLLLMRSHFLSPQRDRRFVFLRLCQDNNPCAGWKRLGGDRETEIRIFCKKDGLLCQKDLCSH